MLAFILCLFCAHGVLVSEASDCDEDDLEKAIDICMEAFNDSLDEHIKSVKEAPKRKGCCLSSSLSTCLKYAYHETDCDDDDDKEMDKTVHNETIKAQMRINKMASYVGTSLCGEMKRETCSESLLHNFDEALREIDKLNGAETVKLSVILAVVATLVYASNERTHI